MFEYTPKAGFLKNKVVLVTGAGDGIGRIAALNYAKHGAQVLLLGRTVEKLEAVYDEIVNMAAPQPSIIPLDLAGATNTDYQKMAESIVNEFGRLDGLLNNASIIHPLGPLASADVQEFEKVMHINVTAQFMLTQALFPALQASDNASVIFTSSGVGRTGRAHWGAYSISKFATEGMVQTWADEMAPHAIRINCINPGGTRTKMRASAFPGEDKMSLPTAQDIMPVYMYLMSDDSLQVNGQSLNAQ